jgi:hypothetical protein
LDLSAYGHRADGSHIGDGVDDEAATQSCQRFEGLGMFTESNFPDAHGPGRGPCAHGPIPQAEVVQ